MREPTNLAKNGAVGPSAGSGGTRRRLPNFDFDTPDEESMQFLEEQWLRFCRSVGLAGEVPDIRAIVAARKIQPPPPPPRRTSHWLVRSFVAVRDWLNAHH